MNQMASALATRAYIAKVCRYLERREPAGGATVAYAQRLFSLRVQSEPDREELAQLVSEIQAAAPTGTAELELLFCARTFLKELA